MLELYVPLSEVYDWAAQDHPSFPKATLVSDLARPFMTASTRTLLDVGIGTGLSSLPLSSLGRVITGVDGSKEMLAICAQKGIAQNLHLIDLESEALPFEESQFDASICTNTLYLLSNADKIIEDMVRVTKPGGIVSFNYEVSEVAERSSRMNEVAGTGTQKQGVYTYSLSQKFMRGVVNEHALKPLASQKAVAAQKLDGTCLMFETLVCRKQ